MGTPILVSDQFVSMATQVEAILSTALSIWIACVFVVLVVVLCTGSLQMACIILLNLLCIVAFVVGLISYNEMEFGGVEAIALIGAAGALLGRHKKDPVVIHSPYHNIPIAKPSEMAGID